MKGRKKQFRNWKKVIKGGKKRHPFRAGGWRYSTGCLVLSHRHVIIITCSRMLQNTQKRVLLQILLSSHFRGSPWEFSGACYNLLFQCKPWDSLAICTHGVFGSAGLSRSCFRCGFSTKNTQVHFDESFRRKMAYFTSHPVHRVVSPKAVEVTCAFSFGFKRKRGSFSQVLVFTF